MEESNAARRRKAATTDAEPTDDHNNVKQAPASAKGSTGSFLSSIIASIARLLGFGKTASPSSKRSEDKLDEETKNTPPTGEVIDRAGQLPVLDRLGNPHSFRSLISGPNVGRRVLVVFLRHFYCGACKNYTTMLSEAATLEKLKSINTSIVLIGCGGPALIDTYVEDTNTAFPVYADPSTKLFDELGMIQTSTVGSAKKYASETQFQFAIRALKDALFLGILRGLPVHKAGPVKQVGGEFLFETDADANGAIKATWCHRMVSHRGHTEIEELMEVLGLPQ